MNNLPLKVCAFALLFMATSLAGSAQDVVADLVVNFEASPANNWTYLWNPNGSIGKPSSYVELKPAHIASDGWPSYTVDGASAAPSSTKYAGCLYLRKVSDAIIGDCGYGTGNGAPHEIYTIMAYKVQKPGTYAITKSRLDSAYDPKKDGSKGNGFHYKIYVNLDLKKGETVPVATKANFDCSLGNLFPGDVIYLAIGPGPLADRSTFIASYQITFSE